MVPKLQIKRVYDPRARGDGKRVLVDRVWPRGVSKEKLGDAVARLNRLSRVRLEIEPGALAEMNVTGVFDAGDAEAFAEAVQSYLPVTADVSRSGVIRLKLK